MARAKDVARPIRQDVGPATRAVIYGRNSSEEQAKNETIKSQLAAVRRWLRDREVQIVREYVDEGVSGTIPIHERPAGSQMLEAARNGEFDTVFVYAMDRFSRDNEYMSNGIRLLNAAGVGVCFTSHDLHFNGKVNATTEIVGGFLSVLAQANRTDLLGKMTRGRRYRARELGSMLYGRLPYGYKVQLDGKVFRPIPDDTYVKSVGMTIFEIVQSLFERAAKGESCVKLSQWLNSYAVPCDIHYPGGTVKKVPQWISLRVYSILKSTTYYGDHTIQPTDEEPFIIKVPPAVDRVLWDRVQVALSANRKLLSNQNAKNVYLLRGIIRCTCGRSMYGATVNGTKVYRCSSSQTYTNPTKTFCGAKIANGKEVEGQVWAMVRAMVLNPTPYMAEYRRQRQDRLDRIGNVDERKLALAKRQMELEVEKKRIVRLFIAGQIDESEKDDLLRENSQSYGAVAGEWRELTTQEDLALTVDSDVSEIQRFLATWATRMDEAETDDRLKLIIIRGLVREVVQTTFGSGRAKTAEYDIALKLDPPRSGDDFVVDLGTTSTTHNHYYTSSPTNSEGVCAPMTQTPQYTYSIHYAA